MLRRFFGKGSDRKLVLKFDDQGTAINFNPLIHGPSDFISWPSITRVMQYVGGAYVLYHLFYTTGANWKETRCSVLAPSSLPVPALSLPRDTLLATVETVVPLSAVLPITIPINAALPGIEKSHRSAEEQITLSRNSLQRVAGCLRRCPLLEWEDACHALISSVVNTCSQLAGHERVPRRNFFFRLHHQRCLHEFSTADGAPSVMAWWDSKRASTLIDGSSGNADNSTFITASLLDASSTELLTGMDIETERHSSESQFETHIRITVSQPFIPWFMSDQTDCSFIAQAEKACRGLYCRIALAQALTRMSA